MAALFTIEKVGTTQTRWMNKLWSIQIMEYYSGINRNEVWSQATIWINLESVMLSKTSQAKAHMYEKDPYRQKAVARGWE